MVKEDEEYEMNMILKDIHEKIEQSLNNCYTTTISLALTINDEGVPENFDEVASKLLKSNPTISAVQLAPNGIIKYIYPLKGNEAAINYNILGVNYLKEEADKSLATQKIYFAGPLKLVQGGTAIIGRLPIYHKNKFWGFTAIIIKLENLLKTSGTNFINHSKYDFQFSRKNPISNKDEFLLPLKVNLLTKNYVEYSIPESNWKIYLISKNQYGLYRLILLRGFFGVFIAIVLGLFTTKLLKKTQQLNNLLKDQEIKLVNNKIKFKTIFDQATIGFGIVHSKSGNFIEANEYFCKMIGYSSEEIRDVDFISLTHPDDIEECLLKFNKLGSGIIKDISIDKRWVTKSGGIIWVNLNVSPLFDTNQNSYSNIVFIKDITSKIEAEKDLNNTFNLATEQNKRLLNFSYIVSHNLRSHTSNIESIISLIETAESEEERKEMMQLLKSVSNSLDETMSHLNEVVNINMNTHLVTKPINLSKYITNAKNTLNDQIILNKATFVSNITDDLIINYNPAYLESIIYNLISNAIRYRSPVRNPIITINFFKENEIDFIEISDNGIGIDLDKNGDKIFGMYKTFSSNPDSRGIGLFITKNQIEAMEGKITVESQINIGTTFKIQIK
jgi:PAS domain S-box-containing protein